MNLRTVNWFSIPQSSLSLFCQLRFCFFYSSTSIEHQSLEGNLIPKSWIVSLWSVNCEPIEQWRTLIPKSWFFFSFFATKLSFFVANPSNVAIFGCCAFFQSTQSQVILIGILFFVLCVCWFWLSKMGSDCITFQRLFVLETEFISLLCCKDISLSVFIILWVF